MKIDGFRELLLRKTADEPNLRSFAKHADSEFLANLVVESLKKMARNTNMGNRANNAVLSFAQSVDSTPEVEGETPKMIRSALGHHISHYKAALGKKKEADSDHARNRWQGVADGHARRAFKMMHMTDRAEKSASVMANGKRALSISYVSPHAWEKHTREQKANPGKFNDTKGLGNWSQGAQGFEYLQKPPHETAKEKKRLEQQGHTGAYPFEHVQVNGKHVHIHDEANVDDSTPDNIALHPMDHHPIMDHFHESPTKRGEHHDRKYHEQMDAYNESDHIDNHYNMEEEAEKADPEAYAKRGSKMSDPVHDAPPATAAQPAAEKEVAPSKKDAESQISSALDRIAELNPERAEKLKAILAGKGDK